MNSSFIKLNAKKQLIKCHFKCFLVSFLPYVTIVLLGALNYYFYILLNSITLDSSYAIHLRASLLTLSVCLSTALRFMTRLFTNHYFYLKSKGLSISFFSSIKKLKPQKYLALIITEILKFFLSIAWASLYYSPCIAVALTLYSYYISTDFTFNIGLTLLIAVFILFVIGSGFLYITLKRYSMTSTIIFSCDEKDSLEILSKSTEIMEGRSLKLSFFNVSFLGWILSCVLIVPIIYVLPYKLMAKYSYFNFATRKKVQETAPQKPIVFYIQKRSLI